MKSPQIYLAGPMVFYPDPASFFDTMKRICAQHGMEGVTPLDNQVGLEGLRPGKPTIVRIVRADFDLMTKMDGAIFCLDPFREGTEMDTGTAVEIGFMKGQQKPMSGWTIDGRSYPDKVRAFFGGQGITGTFANAQGGTSGNERDRNGVLIHSTGCVQNGMAHIGIEEGGGKVFAHPQWQQAFEAGIMNLAEQYNLEPKPPLYISGCAYMELVV